MVARATASAPLLLLIVAGGSYAVVAVFIPNYGLDLASGSASPAVSGVMMGGMICEQLTPGSNLALIKVDGTQPGPRREVARPTQTADLHATQQDLLPATM
ncbi:hypothetical protein ACRAVF_08600 [Bradyrhizobium oligotrophicum S58]